MGYYENLDKEGWEICYYCGTFEPPTHFLKIRKLKFFYKKVCVEQ